MNGPVKLLQATWIAPMDRPLIRDGAVAVRNGAILAVGAAADLRRDFPSAHVEDLEQSVLLPGLINAHTHLELSICSRGESPPASFVEWILGIRQQLKQTQLDEEPRVQLAMRRGIAQCLRFGVTCVGDISQNSHISRPAIAQSPLRCVSYGEALGLGDLRGQYQSLLSRALEPSSASDRLRIGLTPHAPYTVDLHGYEQCLRLAQERHLPLATHLAETPDEALFLEAQAGPFRQLWEQLGLWRDDVPTYPAGPIEFARAIGLLDHPTLLAHVNYCDDAGLQLLARGRASVVYCPRTHAHFAHPPHRWRDMLDLGINVAVGTDSTASSPDLNLVDELRLLRRIAPDMPGEVLWELATVRAARAIQMHDIVGSLTPGKPADLVAFAVHSDAPLIEILDSAILPSGVWIGGERLMAHPAA